MADEAHAGHTVGVVDTVCGRTAPLFQESKEFMSSSAKAMVRNPLITGGSRQLDVSTVARCLESLRTRGTPSFVTGV